MPILIVIIGVVLLLLLITVGQSLVLSHVNDGGF